MDTTGKRKFVSWSCAMSARGGNIARAVNFPITLLTCEHSADFHMNAKHNKLALQRSTTLQSQEMWSIPLVHLIIVTVSLRL